MSDHPMAVTDGELFCAIYPTALVTRILPPYSAGTLDSRTRSNDLPLVPFDFPTSDRYILADAAPEAMRYTLAFGGDVGDYERFHGPDADLCQAKHIKMRHEAFPDGIHDYRQEFSPTTLVLAHNGTNLCEQDYNAADIFQAGTFAVPFYDRTHTAAFLHSLVTVGPYLAAAATFFVEHVDGHATHLLRLEGIEQSRLQRAKKAFAINTTFLKEELQNRHNADKMPFPLKDRSGRKLCKIQAPKHLRGYFAALSRPLHRPGLRGTGQSAARALLPHTRRVETQRTTRRPRRLQHHAALHH